MRELGGFVFLGQFTIFSVLGELGELGRFKFFLFLGELGDLGELGGLGHILVCQIWHPKKRPKMDAIRPIRPNRGEYSLVLHGHILGRFLASANK